jgi:hypothetical protein
MNRDWEHRVIVLAVNPVELVAPHLLDVRGFTKPWLFGDCGAAPSSDLLDQLHLRAVGRGNPAHMPTVVDALFEDLRAILLKVREGAGVIVGLDRDVRIKLNAQVCGFSFGLSLSPSNQV